MARRRAEQPRKVRQWDGTVPARNDLDETRRFAVWGMGSEPPRPLKDLGTLGDAEIAAGVARQVDPGWERISDRWVTVVKGDEDEVDAIVRDEQSIRGYAAYLHGGKTEESPPAPMRGILRGDVAPRRKVDQPRPYE